MQAFPLIVAFVMLASVAAAVLYMATSGVRGRKAQAPVFQALAQRFGGQLVGSRLLLRTPHGPAVIETATVSVVEALGSPYFSDGGTFTLIKARHPTGAGPTFRAPAPQVLPGARLVSNPAEAVVVLRGAIAYEAALVAALQLVSEVTRPSGFGHAGAGAT